MPPARNLDGPGRTSNHRFSPFDGVAAPRSAGFTSRDMVSDPVAYQMRTLAAKTLTRSSANTGKIDSA